MKEFIKFVNLYEMANIYPRNSGLAYIIFVSPKGGAQHSCRIKVCLTPKWSNNNFSVSVHDGKIIGDASKISSDDMKKIYDFIELNRVILLQHWNDEIDAIEFAKLMQKV